MIPYAPFDKKQVAYLKKSITSWLNVLEGGIRAGKNLLNIIAWCQSIEDHPDKLHLAGGVTKAAILMNIIDSNGFGVEHYFAGRCKPGTYNGMECLFVSTRTGQKVIIISGGKDADSFRSIKGNTYGTAYVTEANECHESFIRMVMDRTISSNNRQIFFDLNPKPPRHWFYTDILDYQQEMYDRGENPGYNWEHLTIWNNLSITLTHLRIILKTYDKSSLWYAADILGKRTAATGRIYTGYTKAVEITWEEIQKLYFIDFSIGVDIGGTDATVATLTGFTKGYTDTVLIDGYYHKQGLQEGMDHAAYAREIVAKIEEWLLIYPNLMKVTIFAESADKLFRQAIIKRLAEQGLSRIQVIPSYKAEGIVDRIRLQSILINQGRFRVNRNMKKWHEAYENAMWSDDEYNKGNWVRIDDGSYPVDCLDSSEYSTQPFKLKVLKGA